MNFKKILRVVFGRTTILLLLLLMQLSLLLNLFQWMRGHTGLAYVGLLVLSIAVLVHILNAPMNPNFKIAWIIPIMAIPIVGALFYLFVKLAPGSYRIRKNTSRIEEETKGLLPYDAALMEEIREEDPLVARLGDYMYQTTSLPMYKNSSASYFPLGEEAFPEMLRQLETAESFIFLEYFIIERGKMLDRIEEILVRKVREGVEVRFMYDGMVSLAQMPADYAKKLDRLGIRAKQFSPIKPILSTSYNNRDHRKIMVIDGKVGFTGGINLADEYINERERFGHWKDNAILVRGDAVRSLTLLFLQMWNLENTKSEDYEPYLRVAHGNTEFDGYLMPYGDDPFSENRVGENLYLDLLATAKRSVHIMTPYLILDDQMIAAMSYAAKSGVSVQVLVPHIPDKWYAYTLARTYYLDLIRAGVEIYEYTPGFVHSKVFVVDGEKATVGTVNLDYRSLYLNYECGVYLFRSAVVEEIERDFVEALRKSQRITAEAAAQLPMLQKFIGRFILRMFAPLL